MVRLYDNNKQQEALAKQGKRTTALCSLRADFTNAVRVHLRWWNRPLGYTNARRWHQHRWTLTVLTGRTVASAAAIISLWRRRRHRLIIAAASERYENWQTTAFLFDALYLPNPCEYLHNPYIAKNDIPRTTFLPLTVWVYLHSFSCCSLPNTRNHAKFRENSTLQQFKVIQGHRSWCQLKAHMWLPISH